MTAYNKKYSAENNLFGDPYPPFEAFVKAHAVKGGSALDLGCGQGRDAVMLARHGYEVTGVDASSVGVAQMVERATTRGLAVRGVVADIYTYEFKERFEAIVLDSILHFGQPDRKKELALLNRAAAHLAVGGYLYVFIHHNASKEKALKKWIKTVEGRLFLVQERVVDAIYAEKAAGFTTEFQMAMFILQAIEQVDLDD